MNNEGSLGEMRQGDHFPRITSLRVDEGRRLRFRRLKSPGGVILLTQCCDVARPEKGGLNVAPLVELSGDDAAWAESGRTSRYAKMDHLGEGLFVDLGELHSISRHQLQGEERRPLPDAAARKLLQKRITRRFGRFAFPDDLHPILDALQRQVRSKARNASTPVGSVLGAVETFRLAAAPAWDQRPWDLTLFLVTSTGIIPSLDHVGESDPATSPRLQSKSASEIAQMILDTDPHSPGLVTLWDAFADGLARVMLKNVPVPGPVISSMSTFAIPEDEFSYADFSRSSDIDLDDLSPP